MVTVDDLSGSYPLLVGADRYRCAMGVAAGHHQNPVALEAMVSRKYVGRKIAASHMAEVKGTVGVGPGYGDENAL